MLEFGEKQFVLKEKWIAEGESNELFELLLKDLAWRQNEINMFGKKVSIPRLECYFGDEGLSYSYSGQKLEALPWTSELFKLKTKIEEFSSVKFNSCLCNLYRNGEDSNG